MPATRGSSADAPVLVTIVYFGDSITFGQYIDPALRWTTLVSDRLQRQYLETGVNLLQLNRSISGETTRQALERFPADVQAPNPDIVTIQFGLNDCNCWMTDGGLPRVSPAAYRANLEEMVSRARRFGARQVILSNNHPTVRTKIMLSGERYEEANARYSEIAERVAGDLQATFCDIRRAFQAHDRTPLAELLLPYPDQLHLSVAGNRVYADAIGPLVERAVSDVIAREMEHA